MALPPLLDGADQLTVAEPTPATALTPVGAPGATAAGVTAAEAVEVNPGPVVFTARTVNV